MNKRVISFLLSLVLVLSMLVTAEPTLAAGSAAFTVTADKSTANPGDTVDFSVSIGAVNNFGVLEFSLDIPSGMTIVDSSISIPSGVAETMDSDGAIVVPSSGNGYKWSYSAQSTGYTSSSSLVILKFTCKINSDSAAGAKDVTINMSDCFDNDLDSVSYTINKATVTVKAKPVAVTGVTVDETLSLNVGESKSLNVTVTPDNATNKEVSFSSGDGTVASVDASGKVKGLKAGTTTITVKTADGQFTDTCTVTVSCAHANVKNVDAKESDCKNKGWDAHKECEDCGQLFNIVNGKIDEIPYRELSTEHTELTPSTCTKQAVCSVCGQSYGSTAAHSYTKEDQKEEALKTAGDCKTEAVYYYSCAACGDVEKDDDHTFTGAKDANNHGTYGTSLVNASEPNHDTQTDGYSGDKKCLGCENIVEYGTTLKAGEHVPADVWSKDETHHWKECTVTGCGVVIDGSKAEHESTGDNVANCQRPAICDVCEASYGEKDDHTWSETINSDETHHWYDCLTDGCEETTNKMEHFSETTEATCKEQQVCDACATSFGDFAEHEYGDKVPEEPAEIGKDGLREHYQCSECEKYFVDVDHETHVEKEEVAYEDLIIPALEDPDVRLEIPYTVIVKKTGTLDPGKETFKFKLYDFGCETDYTLANASIETNGVNSYEGKLVITVKESQLGNLSEGFKLAQIKGSSEGWTYDETVYYVMPAMSDTGVNAFMALVEKDQQWEEASDGIVFTNSYKADKAAETDKTETTVKPTTTPTKPTKPTTSNKTTTTTNNRVSPRTGDDNMTGLWLAVMAGCVGILATAVYKRKSFK